MKRIGIIVVLASISSFLLLGACSSNKKDEQRVEISKIVENRSAADLVNELYIACKGDVESLARMLQITPSSIERLRNGETAPTPDFEEKLYLVVNYYYNYDRKYSKLRSVLDSEYGWYDSVKNFPSHHPWIFWSVNIILILALAFVLIIAIWPILIEILIFFIAWIAGLIMSPHAMPDNYIDAINPAIEIVK